MKTITTRVVFAIILMGSSSQLFSADWPQWRGPNRDGQSAETNLRDAWPSDGPTLLWQKNDLGAGYSTPSVAHGAVFFICNKDNSNEEVIALSLADGSQKWATRIGGVGENRGPQYPGARSTPTIDGDSIYALGSAGDLACLDAKTGEIKWSKNLPGDLSGQPGNWAYAESPLIDGKVLVVSPGGPESTVVALDKHDGSIIWKAVTPEGDAASYSSPIIAHVDGVKLYVYYLAKGVVGLNAETGAVLWRYARTADEAANVQTPVNREDYVYTAAQRVGGALIQIDSAKSDPTEVYFEQTIPKGMGGAVLIGDNLYGSSGETLVCVDFTTGNVKWQDRSIGAASVCYADGKLFLHGENNDVAMVAASDDEYRELGRFTPPDAPDRGRSKAWTHPIVADGRLLIRDVGTIWCYDLRN